MYLVKICYDLINLGIRKNMENKIESGKLYIKEIFDIWNR